MSSILDRFRLDDQVAIVTGSGRGIGAATAIAYADAGADVVVSARTLSQLEETAEKVRARGAFLRAGLDQRVDLHGECAPYADWSSLSCGSIQPILPSLRR